MITNALLNNRMAVAKKAHRAAGPQAQECTPENVIAVLDE